MKISLHFAASPFDNISSLPMGIGYLASYIEKNIPEGKIDIAENEEVIFKSNPDLLGISASSATYNKAVAISQRIKKELNIPIIIGGCHITSLPESLNRCFSLGILGEGEETFAELIKIFLSKNSFEPEKLENVSGICFWQKDGGLKINKRRPLIKNLDTLPFPKMLIYKPVKTIPLMTSRGCIFDCLFCSSKKHWGRYRQFSSQRVIEEIKHLARNFRPQCIDIIDDLFVMDKERLKNIVEGIKDFAKEHKIIFKCLVHANLVDEEVIFLLKKGNFKIIRFGAETGSERMLNIMKRGTAKVSDSQRLIDLCQKYRIQVGGSFMFGFPGEKEEDLRETYRFLKKNRKQFFIDGCYLATSFPGTALWELSLKQGIISKNNNWDRLVCEIERNDFNWNNIIYLNPSLPFEKFIKIVENFKKEFTDKKRRNLVFRTHFKKIFIFIFGKKCFLELRDIFEKRNKKWLIF